MSGLAQSWIGSKVFSRSEPTFQMPLEKMHFSRSFSLVQPKPVVVEFYIPVHHIRPEAAGMFRSWELVKRDTKPKSASKQTFLLFDPLRDIGDFSSPPKRFFRSSSRSAAKKLVSKCSR